MFNSDDIAFMREHHSAKDKGCDRLHGVYEAFPKHKVILEWCVHDLHIQHDFLPSGGDGDSMIKDFRF